MGDGLVFIWSIHHKSLESRDEVRVLGEMVLCELGRCTELRKQISEE